MKMSGKAPVSTSGGTAEAIPPVPPQNAAPPAASQADPREKEMPVPPPAPETPSEPGPVQRKAAGNGSLRALVWLGDKTHSDATSRLLERLGYKTEYIDVWEQKVEDIHQGRYDVVATHRNGKSANAEKDLYRLLNILPPEIRRRIFLFLVGEEFTTGNGTQAFTSLADLVCHPQDLDSADIVFLSTVTERARFYRSFLEIEDNL
jgi:hypothetical protein